jgi:hypothetical protein
MASLGAAVKAWDISDDPGVEKEDPDYDRLIAKAGTRLRGEFYPYGLAAWIFLPVFEAVVVENFGQEHAARVLPYVGPVFREALRSSGWIG